jgi:hypothetical protein
VLSIDVTHLPHFYRQAEAMNIEYGFIHEGPSEIAPPEDMSDSSAEQATPSDYTGNKSNDDDIETRLRECLDAVQRDGTFYSFFTTNNYVNPAYILATSGLLDSHFQAVMRLRLLASVGKHLSAGKTRPSSMSRYAGPGSWMSRNFNVSIPPGSLTSMA